MSEDKGLRLSGRLWQGRRLLLGAVDLQVPRGAWVSVLGPSGVGKSTLLRLIAGLPIGGLRFEGQIFGAVPAALMAQDPGLLPWASVAQNAGLGATLRGQAIEGAKIEAILHQTGLWAHRHTAISQLSGGQRQRVALARTMIEDRPLVLLDEPFSALDLRLRIEMQDLARKLLVGRMVVMVSHDPAEAARLSDATYLLTPTALQHFGPPQGGVMLGLDDPRLLARQAQLTRALMGG